MGKKIDIRGGGAGDEQNCWYSVYPNHLLVREYVLRKAEEGVAADLTRLAAIDAGAEVGSEEVSRCGEGNRHELLLIRCYLALPNSVAVGEEAD